MSPRKEDLTNLTVEGVETPLSTAAAQKLIGLSHRGFYGANCIRASYTKDQIACARTKRNSTLARVWSFRGRDRCR